MFDCLEQMQINIISFIKYLYCVFCQKVITSLKETYPADSERHDVWFGYQSLSEAVDGFRQIGHLPSDIIIIIIITNELITVTL